MNLARSFFNNALLAGTIISAFIGAFVLLVVGIPVGLLYISDWVDLHWFEIPLRTMEYIFGVGLFIGIVLFIALALTAAQWLNDRT